MGSVALEPASSLSPAELAALFTASYEGYFMPVTVDEAAYRFMARSWDFDLDASRIALDDDERVGICNLGVRGEDGWIGGVGVVADRRGQGIGRQLMQAAEEEARGRGVKRLWLEVLVQNAPAIALYEKLGYERVRELEVWSLGELVFQKHKVLSASAEPVHERILRERREREPWQRADETIANVEDVEALESEGGAVLFSRTGERVSLLQAVAADEIAARELLESFPADATSLSWLNGPEGDPVNAAIASLGGTETARQHEMVREL
jgi:ribosomal protein S18 acetylase RimI-like enzyme